MSEKIKNYLGLAIIIAVLALGYSALSWSTSYKAAIQPGSYRSFSVAGEGKVTIVPDIAQTSFGVLVEGGKEIGALQKQFIDKGNSVVAFVKRQGVSAKDIKTENYSLEPRYQYYDCGSRIYTQSGGAKPCPPAEIVGYSLRENITVKMRDFEKIGAIMKGGVDAGANTVAGLSFTIDDPVKVESEARTKAIAQAKEKASAVAEAGGFAIGRLLSIEEGGGGYQYNERLYKGASMEMAMDLPMTSAGASAAVEPGSQDVKVRVTLRYEIK